MKHRTTAKEELADEQWTPPHRAPVSQQDWLSEPGGPAFNPDDHADADWRRAWQAALAEHDRGPTAATLAALRELYFAHWFSVRRTIDPKALDRFVNGPTDPRALAH